MQTRHTGLGLPKETPVLVCLVFDEKGVHQLLINPIWNLVCVLEDNVLYLTLASAYSILSRRLANSSFWMASYGHNDEIAHCYKERALSFAVSPSLLSLLTLVSTAERRSRDCVVRTVVPIVALLPTDRATVTRRHGSQRGIGPGPRRGNRRLWRWRHRTVLL